MYAIRQRLFVWMYAQIDVYVRRQPCRRDKCRMSSQNIVRADHAADQMRVSYMRGTLRRVLT